MPSIKSHVKENQIFSFLGRIINTIGQKRFENITQFEKQYSEDLGTFDKDEVDRFMSGYSKGNFNGEFSGSNKKYFDQLVKFFYLSYNLKSENNLNLEYNPTLFPRADALKYTGNNSLDFSRSKISRAILHKL